jgi:hypothetical protein
MNTNLVEQYREHIIDSFNKAEKSISKLNSDILQLEGMTGHKTRHFYNNLLSFNGASYLEVGTWKGSSVCAAMFENTSNVVCIDNWSEFGGPKEEFLVNFNKFKGNNFATFYERDCFSIDPLSLPKFNIYMYDGNHTEDSHFKSISHFLPCLEDIFIFIVDDWNWETVRNGTKNAISQNNLKVLFEKEVRLSFDESTTHSTETWWNGIYVCILQK